MGGCSSSITDKKAALPVFHTQTTQESSPPKHIPLILTLDGSQTHIKGSLEATMKSLKQDIPEQQAKAGQNNTVIQCNGKTICQDDFRKIAEFSPPIDISLFKSHTLETTYLNPINQPRQQSIIHSNSHHFNMSCGHTFTKQQMLDHINKQIDSRASEITCPVPVFHNQPCGVCWSTQQWSQAAGLTEEQLERISQGLLINKIEGGDDKQLCPFCSQFSTCEQEKRVKQCCSVCESSFCPCCLSFWRGRKDVQCDSQRCKFIMNLALNTPSTFTMPLFTKETRQKRLVEVPTIRACPRCGLLTETLQANDKRARCICMGMEYSFCLVCLQLVDPSGKTGCGAYYELCLKTQKDQLQRN